MSLTDTVLKKRERSSLLIAQAIEKVKAGEEWKMLWRRSCKLWDEANAIEDEARMVEERRARYKGLRSV